MSSEKKIGIVALTCLVVGNMIGAGAYVIPAVLAKYGGFAIVGWLVSSLGAVALAFTFAWLSQQIDASGGPHAYVNKVFGDFAGYQMAISYWIMGPIGSAGLVVSTVGYASTFFPILAENQMLSSIIGLALIWGFTFLNFFKIQVVSFIQIFGTIIKVFPLILFGVLGLFLFDSSVFSQPAMVSSLGGENAMGVSGSFGFISAAAAISMWSFIGLESGTVPSSNVINPKRTIPIATIIGVLVVALIYISGCISIMAVIPQETLMKSPAPYVDAVTVMWGPFCGFLMAIVGIIGLIFSLNGWVFIQGYVAKHAADDNLFPSLFSKTNKNGVSISGLVLGSLIMTVIFLMGQSKGFVERVEQITLLGTYATIVPYLYCVVAAFILAVNKGGTGAVKKVKAIGVVSVMSFFYVTWIIIGSGCEVVYLGSIALMMSIPFYFLVRRRENLDKK